MVDVVDRVTRSGMMARIRGRDTKPEMTVRRSLHALGFRFRLHDRRLPGRPDLVLPRYHVAIFVHGCFWHRHEGCRFCTTPATRPEFWAEKFASNVARDAKQVESLIASGWRVAIIWECAVRGSHQERWSGPLADWIKDDQGKRRIVIGTE